MAISAKCQFFSAISKENSECWKGSAQQLTDEGLKE
jgi:hypothetical protein